MPRVEKYAFWRGLQATMPNEIISGRILHCYDTGNVYLDYKDYVVDGQLKRVQLTDTNKLSLSGNPIDGDGNYIPMSGPIILYGEPEDDRAAAPKSYVDNVDTKFTNHDTNQVRHITAAERATWNDKVGEVLYEPYQYEGIRLGVISIDGAEYTVYAPAIVDIDGNAETATKLRDNRYIDGIKFDGTRDIIHYVQCDTLGDDPEKKLEITNFKLTNGAKFAVLFPYDNTADDITLQINDEDPYPIQYHREPVNPTALTAGVYEIVFTGILFEIIGTPKIMTATIESEGLMSAQDKIALNNASGQLTTLNETVNNLVEQVHGIESGTISVTLPEADRDTLGGVYVGSNINVSHGIISIDSNSVVNALGFTPISASQAGADVFIPCTDDQDGVQGLVPAPEAGQGNRFLRGDGNWFEIPSGMPFKGAHGDIVDPDTGQVLPASAGQMGLVPTPAIEDVDHYLKGDGTWAPAAGEVESISDADIDAICVVSGSSGTVGTGGAITSSAISNICQPTIFDDSIGYDTGELGD